jgi:Putative auto-transporter adhesin, head GIN domain
MAIASAPRCGGQTAHRSRLALAAVLVLAVAWVLPGCGTQRPGPGVQGSGIAATQTRAVATFSSVDLAGDNEVTVLVGGKQSVVVHADSNLIGHVTTRVMARTLVIANTGSYTAKTPMSVQVRVPSLAAVQLSGDGMISVSGIKAQRLTMTVPGSGILSASGTTTKLDVTLGGDGEAQLNNLVARHVHAVVSGSGLIQVTATTVLDAAIPGDGALMYSGDPAHVTTSVTGTGAVTPG